jgi:hypothetical protein
MPAVMPRMREPGKPEKARVQARIDDEYLELDLASPDEVEVMRRWIGRVNGSTYPQPYLVESPPGRFRLYIGEAAERVRTARGIQ